MCKKKDHILFLFISLNIVHGLTAVSTRHSNNDPSVPDESDLSVIDEFVNSSNHSASNGHMSNPNSDRGSIPDQSPSSEALNTKNNGDEPVKEKNGEECKCVKYFMCKIDEPTSGNETGSGSGDAQNIYGVVDIRGAELKNQQGNITNATDGEYKPQCESYFEVCCPLKDIKEVNETNEGGEKDPTTTLAPSGNTEGHKSCGHRNENGVGFKMTGATEGEAQFGEFPWTVALIQMETTEDNLTINKYVGGGSLLHPQVVLTVAHNVLGKNRSTLRVRLGEWDTQTSDEPYPSQDRGVKKVIIHEQFLLQTLYNDIALLILDEEVRFAPNVDTICLPPLNNKKLKFDGQLCFSAGWGKDNFGAEGRYSEIMKKVSVPIVPRDKCQELLSKSEKLPNFRLDKSFICAGGEGGEDTCKGDGGSPLVCSLPGHSHKHYVQVGAVSWGLGCKDTYPGVYTDIMFFTPWILKKMDKEEMSTEYCSLQN